MLFRSIDWPIQPGNQAWRGAGRQQPPIQLRHDILLERYLAKQKAVQRIGFGRRSSAGQLSKLTAMFLVARSHLGRLCASDAHNGPVKAR